MLQLAGETIRSHLKPPKYTATLLHYYTTQDCSAQWTLYLRLPVSGRHPLTTTPGLSSTIGDVGGGGGIVHLLSFDWHYCHSVTLGLLLEILH